MRFKGVMAMIMSSNIYNIYIYIIYYIYTIYRLAMQLLLLLLTAAGDVFMLTLYGYGRRKIFQHFLHHLI